MIYRDREVFTHGTDAPRAAVEMSVELGSALNPARR
jgi:hypothetical protein